MPILLYYINYRAIQLTATEINEHVPVKLKSGDLRYIRWLGFIGLDKAKEGRGIPVKLCVSGYAEEALDPRWIMLNSDCYIQGCLSEEGVYGIVMRRTARVI